jgi:hypothetical protein
MKKKSFIHNRCFYSFIISILLIAGCSKEEATNTTTVDSNMRDVVTSQEALNIGGLVGKSLFQSKNIVLKSSNATDAVDKIIPLGTDTAMYLVNFKGNSGFMVLSGDKATAPVIMYSENGNIDPDSVPDALFAWIAQSKSYIIKNRKTLPSQQRLKMKKVWNDLLNGQTYMLPTINKKSTKSAQAIPPAGTIKSTVPNLLTTSWNQLSPFNLKVPVTGCSSTGRAPAGCIAIAMAQVMNYWRFPSKYDWDAIKYSRPNYNDAVSSLVYDAGVSVNMEYACGGSGAQADQIPWALFSKFGYRSDANYGAYDWNKVVSNLNNKWPVIMAGYSSRSTDYTGIWPFRKTHYHYNGGHVWVCSGYLMLLTTANTELDYLWMNWGESYETWCLNTVQNFLSTGTTVYQYNVTAVYDIHPFIPIIGPIWM